MSASGPDLSGCSVWLTRPPDRNAAWQAAFEQAGAWVWVEPLLEITAPDDPDRAAAGLDRAAQADIIIAASANAVAGAARLRPAWSPRGTLIAVGGATAEALRGLTGRAVATPRAADSEGLLAIPELAAVRGRRITVLAGHGGRHLLSDTLAARGAQVEKLALYRRIPAQIDAQRLDQLLAADVIMVTNRESWIHLNKLAGNERRSRLAACRLVVPSPRVVKQASRDVDFQVMPVVIESMEAMGAVAAAGWAWQAPARKRPPTIGEAGIS